MKETETELTPQFETEGRVWERFFEAIPMTEDGCHSRTPWNNGVREAMEEAKAVEILDPQSEDPTIILNLEDGSVLELVNPAQHFCAGFVRLIS